MANVPLYVGKGAFASGTAAISPALPSGITNEDFLVCFVESANQTIPTPSGWSQVTNSPQFTGTAATAGGVRLAVFYKSVAGVESSPPSFDTGNHQTAIIMAFRGVDLANPFSGTAGGVKSTASTTLSATGITTTVDNTLVVYGIGLDKDLADVDTITSLPTNANLTSITERHDQTIASGVGGGIAVFTGIKATAGATGNLAGTTDSSTTLAYVTFGLKAPEPAVRTVGQYRNDFITAVDVGGSMGTDGVSNDVYLQAEYDSGIRTMATTPKAEVDPIATSFSNTASSTLRSMTQADNTSVTRSLRGTSLIYDDVNKRLISFGGYDGTTRYNEVWARYIDKPGQPWRKLSPSGTPPTGRNLHGACFVKGNLTSGGALRAYMVVWSGATPSDTNDMYTLRLDTPGSEAWATVTQTSAPSVRSYMNGQVVAGGSPASDQQHIYIYGGWAAARENGLWRCTFDVDTPTAVTWTTLKASGAVGNPTQTTGAVMAYKASTNKLYLYGGYTGSAMVSTFWEYDIAGNTWTNTSPTGTAPVAAETVSGGYDATNNRFWFTGGWTTNGTFTTGTNEVGYINDVGGSESYVIVRANQGHPGNQTYPEHSFAGFCVVPDKGWLCLKQMITGDPTTDNERYGYIIDFADAANYSSEFPVYGEVEGEYYNARDAMASVWNPDAQEWLNIGGFDDMYDDTTIANGTHSGDVWVYNEADNSWRYAVAGFKGLPPLEGRIACYDTVRDRVIVFGGLSGIEMTSNEVWSLTRDVNGNYLAAPLRPTGTKPTQRWLGACAFDDANNRVIFALGGNEGGPINDVWELSFSGGAQGVWTQRTPTGSVTAVAGSGFVDKKSNKRLYIFGGATNSALSTVVGNFIYLDYSTTNCAWNTVTQSGQTARRTPGMDIDNTWDRILVFGGYNGTNVINTMSWYNLSSGTTWTDAAPATVPDARRSLIAQVINGKFYITAGRPNTGTWYRNTWQLEPNYIVPNSSVWTNKYPPSYTPVYHSFTGGTLGTGYHWQAWTTEGSIDSPKVSHPSRVAYYTFDASDAAVSDPNNVWTDDAYAADGRNSWEATTASTGSTSSNFLHIQGTTAPSSGYTISQVRVKMYGSSGDYDVSATVYTDGLAESLGTGTMSAGASSFTALSTPSGGWTWAKLQALEVKVYATNTTASGRVAKVELEVTTSNAENVADFVLGTVTPSYTKTHTTDAMKKTLGTSTHTTDSDMRTTIHFTKESNASLPTTATPLSTAFTKAEVVNVSSDNATYTDLTGPQYLLYMYERWHTNSTDTITATWNGKSTKAPSSGTVYLQIWNKTSSAWETLDSNNSAAANTDFTLTGGKTTSLSDYYQTGNKVVFRVYQ